LYSVDGKDFDVSVPPLNAYRGAGAVVSYGQVQFRIPNTKIPDSDALHRLREDWVSE
jgi:hypothetical protein